MADDGRLREAEARLLALRIAAASPDRSASIDEIRRRLPNLRALTPADLAPSNSRPREKNWELIVGNAVGSHNLPRIKTSLVARGLAERTETGIRITEAGLEFLRTAGIAT